MKSIILFAAILPIYVNAKTIYQCAVDKVVPHGVRVNIIESKGQTRANLIFGTTVSGTMYNITETDEGYTGQIKNKPEFTLEIVMTQDHTENSNIRGYHSHLRAVYPTLLNDEGYALVETDLICGEKISDRWQ